MGQRLITRRQQENTAFLWSLLGIEVSHPHVELRFKYIYYPIGKVVDLSTHTPSHGTSFANLRCEEVKIHRSIPRRPIPATSLPSSSKSRPPRL